MPPIRCSPLNSLPFFSQWMVGVGLPDAAQRNLTVLAAGMAKSFLSIRSGRVQYGAPVGETQNRMVLTQSKSPVRVWTRHRTCAFIVSLCPDLFQRVSALCWSCRSRFILRSKHFFGEQQKAVYSFIWLLKEGAAGNASFSAQALESPTLFELPAQM